MFKKILVAIDSSEYSRLVLPTAIEVARKFQSDVFVLHVSEHDHAYAAVFSTETPAEATKLVFDAVKAFRDAGLAASGTVHDLAAGQVARNIVDEATALETDLIVMGSRGLSDVQGLLLGSVTHKVMQLSHIAVLVARGPIPVPVKTAVLVPSAATA